MPLFSRTPKRGPRRASLRPSPSGFLPGGNLGAFVSTGPSVTDQILAYGLAAGAAFIFEPALRSGQANSIDSRYGTHAAAIHQSQNLVSIWPSVRTPPAAATNSIPPFLRVPEQVNPTQFQPQIWEPMFGVQGNLILGVDAAPQEDPTQPQAQIFHSARAPAVTSPIAAFVQIGQQAWDFNVQPSIYEPQFNRQGAVPPMVWVPAQPDPRQPQAQYFSVQPATAITPNPAAKFWTTAPQLLDLTQQSQFYSTPIGPSAPQVFRAIVPEYRDLTQQSQYFAPSLTPPAVVGPTVFPQPQVVPQPDLTTPFIALWTPSTFSPSVSFIPPVTVVLEPAGRHKKLRYYVEIDDQQFQVDSPQEAVLILLQAKDLAPISAERAAKLVLRKQLKRKRRPQINLKPPKIETNAPVTEQLVAIRSDIEAIYHDIAITQELAYLFRKQLQIEQDDDEDVILLLH